jgi:hypothetical protein
VSKSFTLIARVDVEKYIADTTHIPNVKVCGEEVWSNSFVNFGYQYLLCEFVFIQRLLFETRSFPFGLWWQVTMESCIFLIKYKFLVKLLPKNRKLVQQTHKITSNSHCSIYSCQQNTQYLFCFLYLLSCSNSFFISVFFLSNFLSFLSWMKGK